MTASTQERQTEWPTEEHNDPTTLHARQLLLLACGGRLARIVYALSELGVADVLNDGPLPVEQIAARTGSHARSLYRVLRCASSVGIFVEGPTRTFALTPLADGLRSDNANGVLPLVTYNNIELTHRPYDEILHSVRTGEQVFEKTLDVPFHEYLARNPETGRFFDRFMSFWSRQFVEEELEQYRFERFSSLADLGGGDGFFSAQVLARFPAMTAYLLDYPTVVEKAHAVYAEHGVDDRVTIVGGDLTEADIPAGFDAYLLKAVLHWMDDDVAIDLLTRIRTQIGDSGARLLVFDSVIAPDNQWDHGKFLDVDMLVLFGGKERTYSDWRELFAAAGFELTGPPPVYHWTLLEAAPVATTATSFDRTHLAEILASRLGVDPDALEGAYQGRLGDLGVDSIGVLELQSVVRDTYGVVLPDDTEQCSLDQIVDHISTGLKGQQ